MNPEDVTLSQLSWAIEGEQSINETEMVDKIVKLPFMSTGVTDAAKGISADAPSVTADAPSANPDAPSATADATSAAATKAAIATPPYHSTKLKLKRNSSGNYDVEKVDNSNEAKKDNC